MGANLQSPGTRFDASSDPEDGSLGRVPDYEEELRALGYVE